jgi:hypothetical protein
MPTKDPKLNKQDRVEGIRDLIVKFGDTHLTPELKTYCLKLLDLLAKKRTCDITRGQIDIWASAIVLVIARLNFLFDKKGLIYLPVEKIYEYFGTKRGAVSLRAAEIEKVCKITIGHEGLCDQEISDQLSFIQLPNGMVMPKSMAKKAGIIP